MSLDQDKLVSFHTQDRLWRAVKMEAARRGYPVKDAASQAFEFWLIHDGSDAALKVAGLKRPGDKDYGRRAADLEGEDGLPIASPKGLEANLEEFNNEHPIHDEDDPSSVVVTSVTRRMKRAEENDDDANPWHDNADGDDTELRHGDNLIADEDSDD